MTTDTITPFVFEGDTIVRVITIGGVLWFVAADVCRALGIINVADAMSGLDQDEKGIGNADTLGGTQQVTIISESGMFSLIFRSRKPHALRFRKWVTSDVLPTIRKTGGYSVARTRVPDAVIFSRRPFEEWSPEEYRLNLSAVAAARLTFNHGTAAWLWGHLGFPVPPRHLLPTWWQADLPASAISAPNA